MIQKIKEKLSKKLALWFLTAIVVAVLLVSGFALGFRYGKMFPQNITVSELSNISSGQPASVNFGTFWQAWDTINKNYLRASKINAQDKVYGAISGLVGSLKDPYSVFLSPKDNEKFQEDVQGNFGGIGAEIGVNKKQLVVIAPLKDKPAAPASKRKI